MTGSERALIKAVPARYPQREPIEEQKPWNDDFVAAMKKAFEARPEDIEVATVYVEAILDQRPWKMWDISTNKVAEGASTIEAQNIFEKFVYTPE